ncbi:MAG TPA: lysophospholipid acyltransferase family protein [Spirochaetota bacterium]|mgnify:CR=1 FL=1|nr:lysophospholipid acyltransferase family protein [Spirochaetota bacterium]HOL56921.1 lysophospholipid acyltransferase family protein [Spirochaetota bacterium]HPP04616.1 lysophospholipid acyltransferase family protein [Spirochaetota bacterium]
MKNKEDRILLRHIFFTIFGWTLFIIINLIQFFVVMPFVWLISILFDRDRVLFPYMIKFFCRLFFLLYFVERINYDKNGLKAPKKGEKRIYVINHASQYDVILMYLLPGSIKTLFKEKWARLPLVGWIAKISKNIILSEDMTAGEVAAIFRKATSFLEKGIPIVIYPEGTRRFDGKIGPFFHGTFRLAVDSQADIVPVIFDSWNCIRPGGAWIRDVRPHIRVLNTIKYEDYSHLNFGKLSHLVRTKMVEGLIDLRDYRRKKEKNYYRKIPKFEEIDNQMREELKQLKEYSEKKKIYLKSEMPENLIKEENILNNNENERE